MDQETKSVFASSPMATFRSARNISGYLVRTKLYPIEQLSVKVGSHKCKGKRCKVCLNVQETSETNKTYKIGHKFECNEKYQVYLLTYKKCIK